MLPEFGPCEWLLGMLAAMMVGFSKTGVPGAGILVVPLMAHLFGGRHSVGALLPMLIFADCFAVVWYRRHVDWPQLWKLGPWVVPGLALGVVLLYALPAGGADWMNPIIGLLVLAMLSLHLLRRRLGDRLTPNSSFGVGFTGSVAGFTTMVSNAAGPVMSIYFSSLRMEKRDFVGTHAWYFFIVNLIKLPIYLALTAAQPWRPLVSASSLAFDALMLPAIGLGAVVGRWMLPRMEQSVFDALVLSLAALAALRLLAP